MIHLIGLTEVKNLKIVYRQRDSVPVATLALTVCPVSVS